MAPYLRKPQWLKIRLETTSSTAAIRRELREKGLHTICEEARCPNLHECWSHHRTATFMILGDTCTRRCRFCAVKTGLPFPPDPEEPQRVAASIKKLGIRHAVITMVDRDDLKDGGARYLAATGKAIKALSPPVTVEYLSSDMMGLKDSVAVLVDSAPDILGHNIETVRRLTPHIRSRSDYQRSLDFLTNARKISSEIITKSGLMLGLGERREEILQTLQDIRDTGCDLVNLGQYLQPSRTRIPVQKYWHPDEFQELKEKALALGFHHVEAGPLVRSSYHAGDQLARLLAARQKAPVSS